MKKKLYNKFLFVFLLVFILLFFSISNVFAYNVETDFIISDGYNNKWIDSYLDLGQDPTYGIKKLIDSHQDYFNFTSNELGSYWVCEKMNDLVNDSYFYYFIIASGPIYIRYHHNGSAGAYKPYGSCEYYTLAEDNTLQHSVYTISFVKNGFYGSSDIVYFSHDGDSASFEMISQEYHTGVFEHTYVAANHDIKNTTNGKEEGSVAFQVPVTKNGTTLAPVIQREKTKGTLQVVLKEIIQILPLIIVVVVSLVGLRKALKMLFQLLRQS